MRVDGTSNLISSNVTYGTAPARVRGPDRRVLDARGPKHAGRELRLHEMEE